MYNNLSNCIYYSRIVVKIWVENLSVAANFYCVRVRQGSTNQIILKIQSQGGTASLLKWQTVFCPNKAA